MADIRSEVAQVADDNSEVFIPEEAFHLLPEELRTHYEAVAEDGRAVLETVEKQLRKASQISRSMAHLVTLRHIQERLSSMTIAATMEYIHELDILTTAFVVAYVRLQQGGGGSGFDRNEIPENLRHQHDEILDLRNKRFAHDDADHDSITDIMEIRSDDGGFEIHSSLSMRYQFNGSPEWKNLIEAIETIYVNKADRLVTKLCAMTGRKWSFAQSY